MSYSLSVYLIWSNFYLFSVRRYRRNWWKNPSRRIWRQQVPDRRPRWSGTTCRGRRCGNSCRIHRTNDCSDLYWGIQNSNENVF